MHFCVSILQKIHTVDPRFSLGDLGPSLVCWNPWCENVTISNWFAKNTNGKVSLLFPMVIISFISCQKLNTILRFLTPWWTVVCFMIFFFHCDVFQLSKIIFDYHKLSLSFHSSLFKKSWSADPSEFGCHFQPQAEELECKAVRQMLSRVLSWHPEQMIKDVIALSLHATTTYNRQKVHW